METADSLKIKFKFKDDQELADLFGKSAKSVVSHWRKNGLPASIEKRAYEIMAKRGIIAEPIPGYRAAAITKVELENMTLEQKLDWIGLDKLDKRIVLEFSKQSEEEQKRLLKQIIEENIEKGLY